MEQEQKHNSALSSDTEEHDWLGLNRTQAHNLFYPDDYDPLKNRWNTITRENGIAALKHMKKHPNTISEFWEKLGEEYRNGQRNTLQNS